MVQRKAPDKLGIQASSKNYVKSDKRLNATKPSLLQNSDIRNKGGGPELKKIMKKSRSVKRGDLEASGGSNPMRRAKPKSDKPPIDVLVSAPVSTPKKPSPVKLPDASPNYMKSTTSSSNARKERSQVIPQTSKTTSDSKSPSLNYRKLFCDSGHKPARALTKTPSLKPVRTLTKTSSNKAARSSSMKKRSGVALCPDQHVERATCSSTLKDSKFPPYVTLHPGGTESEGTSVMKVCPYTYCSLNGHHHAQLPPLKHFVSARRRLLKTQKSIRMKNQSPVKTKCPGERKEDIDTGQMVFHGDHPPAVEPDSDGFAVSPVIEEVGSNYFVEIYAQPREDTSVTNDAIDEAGGRRDADNLSDEFSHSEITIEDNNDQYTTVMVTEMDISMIVSEDSSLQADDANFGGCTIGSGTKTASPAESDLDESMLEAIDMDWEEGHGEDQHLAYEADLSNVMNDESDPNATCLQGLTDTGLHNDFLSSCPEEVPPNDEMQVVHVEYNTSLHVVFGDYAFELDGENPKRHLSFDEDVFEEPEAATEDKDGAPEQDHFITNGVSSDPAECQFEELTASSEEKYGASEPENDLLPKKTPLQDENTACNIDLEYGTQMEEQEEYNFTEQETEKDDILFPEDSDIDAETGSNNVTQLNNQHANVEGRSEEKRQIEDSYGFDRTQTSSICQDSCETDQENGGDQQQGYLSISSSAFSEGHGDYEGNSLRSVEQSDTGNVNIQTEDKSETDATESCPTASHVTGTEGKNAIISGGRNSDQEFPEYHNNRNRHTRSKRSQNDSEEARKFNPREPNFLPVEPDPEGETVDLRHQMIDERKNAEEWMLDYALRQTVNKLAPARKRRVALLVEAFETVSPLPKYESHLPHSPAAFTPTRFIQACN